MNFGFLLSAVKCFQPLPFIIYLYLLISHAVASSRSSYRFCQEFKNRIAPWTDDCLRMFCDVLFSTSVCFSCGGMLNEHGYYVSYLAFTLETCSLALRFCDVQSLEFFHQRSICPSRLRIGLFGLLLWAKDIALLVGAPNRVYVHLNRSVNRKESTVYAG
jgi:hypothetical protein